MLRFRCRGRWKFPGMERVTADLGKCPVCGVAKVEWIDEEDGSDAVRAVLCEGNEIPGNGGGAG